ncbi:MAG: pyruvate formate lyase family protein, partial [Oscillospiraceae bacterium]|nr:pyruvate formate lyase family protein [Oscillospiraceae bacterium]
MKQDNKLPLAIEPYDREWGVGVSGLTENPSPFPRVNRVLKHNKEIDSTADSQRALIVTECFKKYEAFPANIKWAMTLREVLSRVTINIWPDEIIVGELAAPPNGAPVYPEFSFDWVVDEITNKHTELRKNDKYIVDDKTKADLLSIKDYWKGRTVSEATVAQYTEDERLGSH